MFRLLDGLILTPIQSEILTGIILFILVVTFTIIFKFVWKIGGKI